MAITHRYTLLCDEVRQENNGKFIVIGLYTGNIAVPQFPCVLPFLTFFMFVNADRPGQFSMKMRLENMESGQRMIEGMGMMGVQKPGSGASPLRVGPVQFQSAGTYNFVVEIEGEREPIVTSFEVALPPAQALPIRQGR